MQRPEQLARVANGLADRNPALVHHDAYARRSSELAERGGESSARRVARAPKRDPRVEQRVQWLQVVLARRGQRLLDLVIARDHDRVGPAHQVERGL